MHSSKTDSELFPTLHWFSKTQFSTPYYDITTWKNQQVTGQNYTTRALKRQIQCLILWDYPYYFPSHMEYVHLEFKIDESFT